MAKILLVDDTPAAIAPAANYLEKAGHAVRCATNGHKALVVTLENRRRLGGFARCGAARPDDARDGWGFVSGSGAVLRAAKILARGRTDRIG